MSRFTKLSLVLIALTFLGSAMSLASSAEKSKGTLKAVFPDKYEMVITEAKDKDTTYTFDKNGKVFINNNEAKLADLNPGEEVTIVYEMKMEMRLASEVRCKRN